MEQTEEIKVLVENQHKYFERGVTKDIAFRKAALLRLQKKIKYYEKEIAKAIYLDLHKSDTESYMTEIGMVLSELRDTIKKISAWTANQYVKTPLAQFPAVSFIKKEPYGVVLIMSPWNYPFLLTMGPLIGAIAAGNCVTLKPSDYSKHTSCIINKIITSCFPKEYVCAVTGGRERNQKLLDQRFDYIFFTGGVQVGKLVMEHAAKNLTPVTLELGGKSPCIIDETANLKMAAKRIVFGKFLNAGQTCVAPDYVLISKRVKEEFLYYAKAYIQKMYGKEAKDHENYSRIINEKHFKRIVSLLPPEKDIVIGGTYDEKTRYISPTILDHVTKDSAVMQEEIFGPLLPILTFDELQEAIQLVKDFPKPLACYIFTESKENETKLLRELSFGGGCINDTVIHLASSVLPFGGVGESGMGSYHGKYTFDTFSHQKSIVKKSTRLDLPFRYPPYTKVKAKLIQLFLH